MKSNGEMLNKELKYASADDLDLILTELMVQYGTDLTTLAYTYTNNTEAAKDIVQNVYIKCYKKLHTFKGQSSIKTWLFRITINQCKDYLRSSYFRRVIPTGMKPREEIEERNSTEKVVLRKNMKKQIQECINKLPTKYKDSIYLYYVQELSLKETADILGVPIDTVKTRLRRAKEKLLPLLNEEDMFYDE